MVHRILIYLRIFLYRQLWDDTTVTGSLTVRQPLLCKGQGQISFGTEVEVGVLRSPEFYTGYAYLEARLPEDKIIVGDAVKFNNGFSATAFKGKITIGNKVLFGRRCSIITSDFHMLDPDKRDQAHLVSGQDVTIEKNVFIGDGVYILKGVTIGENSVIGNGSVVSKDIPANCVAAGNPAKPIKSL